MFIYLHIKSGVPAGSRNLHIYTPCTPDDNHQRHKKAKKQNQNHPGIYYDVQVGLECRQSRYTDNAYQVL
jgi:hypothetical protein